MTQCTDRLSRIVAFPVTAAIPADVSIGALDADGRVALAAEVGEELTSTATSFGANTLSRLITIVITRAFKAASTHPAVVAKWGVSTAAYISLEQTRLALTIIALRQCRVITLGVIDTAHAIGTEVLDYAERSKLKAAFVALRVTHPTRAIDAVIIETIALVIVETRYTPDAAIGCLFAEWRVFATARIIGYIADHAVIRHALPEAIGLALGIFDTGHALVSIFTLDTDTECVIAAVITALLADLTDPHHALVETRLLAVLVSETADAIHATGAERRVPTTAGVVGDITETAIAVDTLTRPGLIAIAITAATHTSGPIVYTERRSPITARIIRRVAQHALLTHALATITITVDHTLYAG